MFNTSSPEPIIKNIGEISTEDLESIVIQISEEIDRRANERARDIEGRISALIAYAIDAGFGVYIEGLRNGEVSEATKVSVYVLGI